MSPNGRDSWGNHLPRGGEFHVKQHGVVHRFDGEIQVSYGTEYRGTPKSLISSFRLNAVVDNFAAWTLPENRNAYMEASIAWLRRHRFAHLTAGQPTHSFPEIFNQLPDGTRRPDPTYFGGKWPELISMDMGEPTLAAARNGRSAPAPVQELYSGSQETRLFFCRQIIHRGVLFGDQAVHIRRSFRQW
jgi:hypothetical protein